MKILNWIQDQKDLLIKYAGTTTMNTIPWIEFVDISIRIASGILGLALTAVLIYKAVWDIKKNKKG